MLTDKEAFFFGFKAKFLQVNIFVVCADYSVALAQQNAMVKFKINAFLHKFNFNLGSSVA